MQGELFWAASYLHATSLFYLLILMFSQSCSYSDHLDSLQHFWFFPKHPITSLEQSPNALPLHPMECSIYLGSHSTQSKRSTCDTHHSESMLEHRTHLGCGKNDKKGACGKWSECQQQAWNHRLVGACALLPVTGLERSECLLGQNSFWMTSLDFPFFFWFRTWLYHSQADTLRTCLPLVNTLPEG